MGSVENISTHWSSCPVVRVILVRAHAQRAHAIRAAFGDLVRNFVRLVRPAAPRHRDDRKPRSHAARVEDTAKARPQTGRSDAGCEMEVRQTRAQQRSDVGIRLCWCAVRFQLAVSPCPYAEYLRRLSLEDEWQHLLETRTPEATDKPSPH